MTFPLLLSIINIIQPNKLLHEFMICNSYAFLLVISCQVSSVVSLIKVKKVSIVVSDLKCTCKDPDFANLMFDVNLFMMLNTHY